MLQKIYFIGLAFNEEYYRTCTVNDGIRNVPMMDGILSPTKYITDMFEDMKKDKTSDSAQDRIKRLKDILGLDK